MRAQMRGSDEVPASPSNALVGAVVARGRHVGRMVMGARGGGTLSVRVRRQVANWVYAPAQSLFRLVSIRPQSFVRPQNKVSRGSTYLYERRSATRSHSGEKASPPSTSANSRLRILFLASSSDRYGSDRALAEMASSLSALGYDVAVLAPRDGPLLDALREAGVLTIVAPLCIVGRSLGPKAFLRSAAASVRPRRELLEAIGSLRPDVVCSNTSHVVDGPQLARALGARHVWHLREIERIPTWARRLYGRWLSAQSDRVLPISKSVEAAYFPAGSAYSTVITDGINLNHYRCEHPRHWPSVYSAERPLRVLTIGRLTPWKGQDVAIAAVGALLLAGRPLVLRVVGGALTQSDRAFEQRLRAMATPYGPAVTFEGEVDDVRPHYCWSDAVLHAATQPEPFGRVVVEAMASGRAVIASDDGGPREIIRDDIDGWLSPPGDVAALIAKLRDLVQSPSSVARIAAAAQERAAEFGVELTAQRLAGVLREICTAPVVSTSTPRRRS